MVCGSRQGAAAAGPLSMVNTKVSGKHFCGETPPPTSAQPRSFPRRTCLAQSNPPKDSINPKKGVTDRGILRLLPRHPPLGWRSAWDSNQSQTVDGTQGIKFNTSNLDFSWSTFLFSGEDKTKYKKLITAQSKLEGKYKNKAWKQIS